MKKEQRINPVEAMKVLAITGAALVGSRVVTRWEQSEIDWYKQETERALRTNLGLTPDQVSLDWNGIGWHGLSEGLYDRIKDEPRPVILGELTPKLVRDGWTAGSWVNQFLYGVGMSEEKSRESNEVFQKLVSLGASFVTTDGDVGALYRDGSVHSNYTKTLLLTCGLLVFGDVFYQAYKTKESKKMKEATRDILTILAGSIATSSTIRAGIDSGKISVPPGSLVAQVNTAMTQSESVLEEILGSKEVLTKFHEGLVRLRNQIMALNVYHTLSSIGPRKEKMWATFFSGYGHTGAVDDFLKGPDFLVNSIGVHAEKLASFLPGVFAQMLNRDGMDELRAIFQLALYMNIFSQPEVMGPEGFFDPSLPPRADIPSAALVLFQHLALRIPADKTARMLITTAQQQYMHRLLQSQVTMIEKEAGLYQTGSTLASQIDAGEPISLIFFPIDSLFSGGDFGLQMFNQWQQYPTGYALYHNRIHPLTSGFYLNKDGSISVASNVYFGKYGWLNVSVDSFVPTSLLPPRTTSGHAMRFSRRGEGVLAFGRVVDMPKTFQPGDTYYAPAQGGSVAGMHTIILS